MSFDSSLVIGRQLLLITGQVGSGKSHLSVSAVSAIRQDHPDIPVYADIEGLNIDGVLPSPEDWRETPANSIIFYDEAQKKTFFENSNKRINDDPRIRDLTTVRHEGKTIVFITQDPSFLHTAITKLIKTHYHVSNPFENDKPKVFEFNKAIRSIDDKGVYQKQAVNQFTHTLDKEIFPLYKSIEDGAVHKKTRKRPNKVYYMIALAVALILITIPALYYGVKTVYSSIFEEKTISTTNEPSGSPMDAINPTSAVSVGQQGAVFRKDLHNKFLPTDTVDIASDENIRPAMVIQSSSNCRVYNHFGDRLMISVEECMIMSDDPTFIPRSRQLTPVPSYLNGSNNGQSQQDSAPS